MKNQNSQQINNCHFIYYTLIKILSTSMLKNLANVLQRFKLPVKSTKNAKIRVGTACILSYFCYELSSRIGCIQDKTLLNTKRIFQNSISEMKSQFGQMAIYPAVKYNLRGNTYTIEYEIDQRKCDIFQILTMFLSNFSDKDKFRIVNCKTINQQGILTLQLQFEEKDPRTMTPNKGCLTISGMMNTQRTSFRLVFQKNDVITENDTQALIKSYKQSIKPKETKKQKINQSQHQNQKSGFIQMFSEKKKQNVENFKKLEELGVTVFKPEDKIANLDWDYLAGYQKQKRDIQDTVLLALSHPQIYDQITEGTRMKNQPNRPKAILFEGPPGTGKTTSAKIIAQQVQIPLVYMPIQAIMSKYYGESEKKLGQLWQVCKNMGKIIIFIDEIDALAGSRSSDMHEASRRVLSTLLRKIDSFESSTDVLLICATNRKKDLDAAMLSRIDLSIKFDLPDVHSRSAIFKRYAKQLSDTERFILAEKTEGFSGRNISDICKNAERRWASKLIRKQVEQKLPTVQEYINSLNFRKQNKLDFD